MTIQSVNQLIDSISSGRSWRQDWNKITGAGAYTAGRWHDLSSLAGTPNGNTYAGTALAWQQCSNRANPAGDVFGIYTGPDTVSPSIKHGLKVSAVSSVATAVPSVLMLVDVQGYYPGIATNSALSQTLTGTPTLRYTNGNGVRMFTVVTAAPGANARNLSYSYTNQDGTSGRANPVTVSCTASSIVTHIEHSGLAASNYGPFLPMASSDFGIRSVQSVQFSAASVSAGTVALVLARPLLEIPLVTASVLSERDLVNQVRSMPVIPDGACLSWIYFAGAATAASTNIYGALESVWG